MPTFRLNSTVFGVACGVTMAVASAASFTAARAGMLGGVTADELVLLRYLVAGLVFLPFLLRWGLPSLAGIGWTRGLILLLYGGPLFGWLQFAAYNYAPLAHGAIILPPTVTILSTIAAAVFLKEHLGAHHLAGTALVIGGIALLGWDGIVNVTTPWAWIGDLMFLAAAVLWACFTVLMRHWRLSPLRVVAIVSLLSSVTLLPTFAISGALRTMADTPWSVLATQGLVQGLLQGLIGVAAYTHAIRVLGVSRAVLFPATIPALAVLLGIPTIGETPSPIQIVGLAVVTAGLLTAVGVLRILRRLAAGSVAVTAMATPTDFPRVARLNYFTVGSTGKPDPPPEPGTLDPGDTGDEAAGLDGAEHRLRCYNPLFHGDSSHGGIYAGGARPPYRPDRRQPTSDVD